MMLQIAGKSTADNQTRKSIKAIIYTFLPSINLPELCSFRISKKTKTERMTINTPEKKPSAKRNQKNDTNPHIKVRRLLISFDFFTFFRASLSFPISELTILKKALMSSSYLLSLRRGRRWFSMISLHHISVYSISIHFPVMSLIFFSSVAIMRRSPLFFHFWPIPFSLNTFIPISRSSWLSRCGKSTTTTCSVVALSWDAKSSFKLFFSSSLRTHEKSLMK